MTQLSLQFAPDFLPVVELAHCAAQVTRYERFSMSCGRRIHPPPCIAWYIPYAPLSPDDQRTRFVVRIRDNGTTFFSLEQAQEHAIEVLQ
jgi:hypothetical protein